MGDERKEGRKEKNIKGKTKVFKDPMLKMFHPLDILVYIRRDGTL